MHWSQNRPVSIMSTVGGRGGGFGGRPDPYNTRDPAAFRRGPPPGAPRYGNG